MLCSPLDDGQWCTLYAEYILESLYCSNEKCTAHSDDMLWYVPLMKIPSSACVGTGVSFKSSMECTGPVDVH